MLDGSRSHFNIEVMDETLNYRLVAGDIHPTGPLPGKGDGPVSDEIASLERSVLEESVIIGPGPGRGGVAS